MPGRSPYSIMTYAGPPIVLFCDFGLPYTAQMKARLCVDALDRPVLDLFWDVPAGDVCAGSVLLAAFASDFPLGTVFVCVVDPDVGTLRRKPGVIFAGGRWFVGPLNGLFEHVLRRWAQDVQAYEITWIPEHLSATFHGRDLFAPTAARVANGNLSGLKPIAVEDVATSVFDDDVVKVVYIDGFGNLMTGVRAATVQVDETLGILGHKLPRVRTFADIDTGALFCYENAVGLMEIAAYRGNAAEILQIGFSTPIKIIKE